MLAQAITDSWSLIGNTIVGAALIYTQAVFIKEMRTMRKDHAKERAEDRLADREDRRLSREEYTEALRELAHEVRGQ